MTDSQMRTPQQRADRGVLWALIGIGVLLRFWDLGGRSLWLDEVYSVWRASLETAQMWQAPDPHPPLYYQLLAPFARLGTEAAVRLPSAMASASAIGIAAALARQIANTQSALLAAALVAVSPLDIWYAQEARMYALLGLLVLVSILGAVRQDRLGVLLAVTALTAAIYVDYLALPLWAGASGAALAYWLDGRRSRRPFLAWLASSAAVAVAAWPLWPHAASTADYAWSGAYFMQEIRGHMPDAVASLRGRDVAGIGLAGIAAAAMVATRAFLSSQGSAHRRRRAPVDLAQAMPSEPHPATGAPTACEGAWQVSPVAMALPVVVAIVSTLAPIPHLYTLKKFAVAVWPLVLVACAMWLTAHRQARRWSALLLAVSLSASVTAVLAVEKDDWRALVNFINTAGPSTRTVVLDQTWDDLPFNHYGPANPPVTSHDPTVLTSLLDREGTLWLVAHRRLGQPVPSSEIEAWLDAHTRLSHVEHFARLELRLYAATQGGR